MRSDSPKNTHKHVAPRNTLRIPGKRSHRLALFGGAFLAVAGLVAGGGFAVQSAVATQERVSATTALAESTGLDHAQLGAYAGIAKAHTGNAASIVLVRANLVIAATQGKVDASGLSQVASSLADYKILPLDKVVSLTAQTKAATASVTAAAAAADRAAAVAARAAAAKRAAALAASNTPAGAQATARAMALSRYGWGSDQFSCLAQLWQKESGWNYKAYNPSGATGIPQALPGSKMASAGTDWATNATTQIAWGLEYISASSYGTPCAAWSHSQAFNWY
jgi:hypothetical protein